MALEASTLSPVLAPHPELDAYYTNKRSFLNAMFDQTACDYEGIERWMALGSGSWYRRRALLRGGLTQGMRVLDVAIGTGLVAREAANIVGQEGFVLGVDPSIGMLSRAIQSTTVRGTLGLGERLPIASETFDFLSMGYALRHLSDLNVTFRQFSRVLKPGGRLCVLEITRPQRRWSMRLMRLYMRRIVPILTRLMTGHADSQLLWRYYWDTIESCVAPELVLDALNAAGFENVTRHSVLGIFSEYTATRP